ncbi:hypothetical protein EGJ86_22155 [Pseudomonas sp. o96-267]|uniref:hypothetical protein n=1 Tax=Pseudomonas sp. o96-267 TaxID=2479853 RepID=UPI000F7B11A1|nr:MULTISPECIES: hypothetical protein [Pseudomonas]MDH0960926.1 hypothetical protein [Pseudomonas chengduensis]MDV5863656.1 hypothetical protein [Pseudomonas mendocina]RRV29945.1 hypothetical protein EGJ86_22155 [Pseudomonas sp. o96-267]
MKNDVNNASLKDKMPSAMAEVGMADPGLLTGSNISQFVSAQNLHLIELSMGLGVNSAALYTKKGAGLLNSTLSLLLRLYAAFPEHLPRFKTPTYESLIERITEIDPTFKPTNFGPLLGLEINSSFRLKTAGLEGSAPTVRSLAYLIKLLIDDDPNNWWIIKDAVEIEAKARKIVPAESVWQHGGWKKHIPKPAPLTSSKAVAAGGVKSSSTAKPLHRRQK